jgi:hypothetical protein
VAADEGPACVFVSARGARPWRLLRRSQTLKGNVPLRAAQSCTPFLLGNAFGWQLEPPEPLRLRRGLTSLRVEPPPLSARALSAGAVEVRVDTGLTLRPLGGVLLQVERAHNRRDRRVAVVEEELAGEAPLHLVLRVALRRGQEAVLSGELASIAPFAPLPSSGPGGATGLRQATLAEAPEVGRAHLSFFDQDYFAEKRGAATRRYRDLSASRARAGVEEGGAEGGEVLLVHAGGAAPLPSFSAGGALRLDLPLELAARVSYFGQRVQVALDPAAQRARARRIEALWQEALGAGPELGAIRYFTTYVTPHTAGDPHLFFKPAALLRTPPGWCAVIDGPADPAWEVLRGVTEPDWFHALPAVLALHREEIALRAGTPLLRVRPVPRRLLQAGLRWA